MKRRIGIIDIGSNTVRVVVYEVDKGIFFRLIEDESIVVRLAEYGENNQIPSYKISLLVEVLNFFKALCKMNGVAKQDILVVATAAIRDASNKMEVLENIKKSTELEVKVLSEFEEANYNLWAIKCSLNYQDGLLVDIGGGSTEFVYFKDKNLKYWGSIRLGAVNCSKMIMESSLSLNEIESEVKLIFEKYRWMEELNNVNLIGIGGSIRNLGRIIQHKKGYPITTLHNFAISYQEFIEVYNMLQSLEVEKRKSIPGLSEKRSDIILGAFLILKVLIERIKAQQIYVSSYGLREGILFESLFKDANSTAFSSEILLEYSINNYLNFFSFSKKHAKNVCRYATMLFDQLLPIFPNYFTKEDRIILKTAALLHDIGTYLSFYQHAQHSAYVILNLPLFGISHQDIILTAEIISFHENSKSKAPFLTRYINLLSHDKIKKIKPLAFILKLAEILDKRENGLVTSIRCSEECEKVVLRIYSKSNLGIEISLAERLKPQFEKIFGKQLIIKNNM
ncbi:Ppx/GppA phosphatase family protein [Anaerocellum diazotrophicum]|uniref:Exopolyphosphatase n=1 Tax=Caldicellulosiruptor diazotrophicus TaxID=2806205 RepID=A0ABN6E9L8_9FIRM|nr:Ppx/GppA phosphatase family protein [Caldicellulosiruptor diazotrophicus]BCS82240.1 exopolyphosphatase [Caldicellulosiruptor diazotrophicus]